MVLFDEERGNQSHAKVPKNDPQEDQKVPQGKPKETVTWHVLRSIVVVEDRKKVDDPVKFLVSQLKTGIGVDVVELVNEAREESFG